VKHLAQHVTVFPSVARTASHNSQDFSNSDFAKSSGIGAVITIDCTADPASASVVFTVQGKDPTSGKYYTILASAAIAATGTTTLRVHPDLTAAANTVAKDMMPAVWRVAAVHADGDSITYSVGASIV